MAFSALPRSHILWFIPGLTKNVVLCLKKQIIMLWIYYPPPKKKQNCTIMLASIVLFLSLSFSLPCFPTPLYFFLETGSHVVSQATVERSIQPRTPYLLASFPWWVLGLQAFTNYTHFSWCTGTRTQSFVHARWALYQLSHPPGPTVES